MIDFLLNNGVPTGLKYYGATAMMMGVSLALVWFYAMYDCLKNEKDEKFRMLWLAVLLVGKFLAVFVYFFGVMLPRIKAKKAAA
ncbi:MAG TPA: hypothetical protein DDW67_06250 [Elusimicrobia bacterium]|jgi:hypothetical protein|nr:hypothetical protein [Elusimicrobiota bacterium]